VFDIPEGNRQSKGRAIQNLVQRRRATRWWPTSM
jgi:hypothetical protein